MPKRSKRSKRSKRRPNVLHNDLKTLIELQKADQTTFSPEVTDVPKVIFARNRHINVSLSYNNTITTTATVASFGAIAPSLSLFAQYSPYVTAYDQYRIIQLQYKWIPQTFISNNIIPFVASVIDYDDATAPSSLTTVYSYDSLMVSPANVVFERVVTPRIAIAAYAGAFTSYANTSCRQWLDSASTGVLYYGLKYAIPAASISVTFTVLVTASVQFRSQRST